MLSQRRIAQIGLVGAVVILCGSIVLLLGAKDEPKTTDTVRVQAGMPAPAIKIESSDGHSVNLNEKGHLTVLCFDSASQDCSGRLRKLIIESNEQTADVGPGGEIDLMAGPAPTPNFVTLQDDRGVVASRFDVHANRTFFVIDENGLILYRGALDNKAEDYKLTENYFTSTLRNVGDGKQVTVASVQGWK
jgi:hypothetical protein